MKANVKSKIVTHYADNSDYIDIKNKIPLNYPLSIRVEPTSQCNFSCRFCANGNKEKVKETNRYHGHMGLELFRKIVLNIMEFEHPLRYLYLYKDGEPFLNPHLFEMIKFAKKYAISKKVLVTSNGSLLNQQNISDFVESECDEIIISVYGVNNYQYLKFTRTKIDFEKFVSNIRLLYTQRKYCKIHLPLLGNLFSKEDVELFFKIFGDYADTIKSEQAVNFWPNFDLKKLDTIDLSRSARADLSYQEVQVCPNMFYSLSINADGLVSACPCDWARQVVVGDVRKSSLKDIWTGNPLAELRRVHLSGNRHKHHYCGKCFFPNSSATVNLDDSAVEILSRMK